ncbi:putative component of type VI protein secretion system [Natronobacillus azotifigens]|uniref:DUF4430 domain-containing protein n=1 Tax=Natronobacillus azotifigens TaxID=472978 RepID=A0A9J6R935_9BACI|nr:DUF4430 domain-containing protein [Natronobacillus azotifigens]MCZ0701827.1 DUF4430 domain-containing protein [Natronobacillus azotifigens]
MKKTIQFTIILMISVALLFGCAQDSTETQGDEPFEVTVTISVDYGDEVITDDSFMVEPGTVLLDLLEQEYEVEKTADGFITAIEGIEQDGSRFWIYEVNREEAQVGAGDFELSPDDQVVFDLHAWE